MISDQQDAKQAAAAAAAAVVVNDDNEQLYTEGFYKDQQAGSRQSAQEVVPLVLQLTGAQRIIDVGCGVGTWLRVFEECGVKQVLGVDGDYVDKKMLHIAAEQFVSHDLRTPLHLDQQFDLAVSLEVAEHLPEESAEVFVDSLVRLAPVILFSAALPLQEGTHHINEQWPDYWASFFQAKGFAVIDCIRKRVWQNDKVEWWYAQNMLVFAQHEYLENHPTLKHEFGCTNPSQLSIVHPKLHLAKGLCLEELHPKNRSLSQTIAALPALTKRAVEKRVKTFL